MQIAGNMDPDLTLSSIWAGLTQNLEMMISPNSVNRSASCLNAGSCHLDDSGHKQRGLS